MKWNEYRTGVGRGLPVGMGYFSVSFGFGAMAVSQGLGVMDATLISLSNLTSAGQFAGLTVIVAAATLWAPATIKKDFNLGIYRELKNLFYICNIDHLILHSLQIS